MKRAAVRFPCASFSPSLLRKRKDEEQVETQPKQFESKSHKYEELKQGKTKAKAAGLDGTGVFPCSADPHASQYFDLAIFLQD